MEPGEVEMKGLPAGYFFIEPGVPTCISGRQLDWFMGSPAFVNDVEVWADSEGTKAHRGVYCRFKIALDGDIGGRAKRPQAFRGLTRDESRKRPREEGISFDVSGNGV